MKRILFAILALGLFVGANCETIHPPEGPGTSYPCGYTGVECPDHSCCPAGHECGGFRGRFSTCPPGYCCYTGQDDWPRSGSALDAGSDA